MRGKTRRPAAKAAFLVLCLLALTLSAKTIYEIHFSPAQYLTRSGKAWRGHSRFVGVVKDATEKYKITFIEAATGRVVKSEERLGDIHVYEGPFLPAPANYVVKVEADGYTKGTKNVNLKPKTDCVLDIIFFVEDN